MAGKLSQHLGKEGQGGDLRIVSQLCTEQESGGARTGQIWHQRGGSVVLSRTIHQCTPRQQMRALLRMGTYREQVQQQSSMRLLLRAAPHQHL